MDKTENIDAEEVEKFSTQANEWWNTRGSFKTLHDINPTRLNFILSKTMIKNTHILDIGCGGGILSEAMARQGGIVTGIDASQENISVASRHAEENKLEINYVVGNAEQYSNDHKENFDLITCMELLEHVPDPFSIIKACAEMIKPGGHIIFSTINRNLKAYLLAVVTGEYLLKLLPVGTHQYKNFIRPSELANWCKQCGLQLNDLKGMSYNPFLDHCIITDRPDVNYLIDTTTT